MTTVCLALMSDSVNCVWVSVCGEEELLCDTLTFLIYILLPLNLCRVCWLYYQPGAEMLHPDCKYVTWTTFHHISPSSLSSPSALTIYIHTHLIIFWHSYGHLTHTCLCTHPYPNTHTHTHTHTHTSLPTCIETRECVGEITVIFLRLMEHSAQVRKHNK